LCYPVHNCLVQDNLILEKTSFLKNNFGFLEFFKKEEYLPIAIFLGSSIIKTGKLIKKF